MIETIKVKIAVLAKLRQEEEEASNKYKEIQQKFLDDNAEFLAYKTNLANSVLATETEIRTEAIETYKLNSESKDLGYGVGIRILEKLNYNEKNAQAWAMEHKLALKLDVRTFEKIAKSSDIPFVTKTQEVSATIASDLKPFVQVENETN